MVLRNGRANARHVRRVGLRTLQKAAVASLNFVRGVAGKVAKARAGVHNGTVERGGIADAVADVLVAGGIEHVDENEIGFAEVSIGSERAIHE